MARYAGWGRKTCESCHALDVRRLYRKGLLSAGLYYSWQWTCNGEPDGEIRIRTETDRLVLNYRIRQSGEEWESVEQRVPIVWTPCRFGGRQPWFICSVYADGRYCGRRVAKLYGAGKLFACRHCYHLAYASQQASPPYREMEQAQKIRMRLGGTGSIDEPFPDKPKGMHWTTFNRLETRAERLERQADAMMAVHLQGLEDRHR
jgi:hypothetical protein